jgi:cobalt-zinc-cadmium efflux system protein
VNPVAGHHHQDERLHSDRWALAVALVLIAGLTAAELATGIVAHSLALLADSGHLVSDVAALGFALVAAAMSSRPAPGRWTFGFRRLEILAAQANGVMLGLVGIWIVYSAIGRLVSPPDVSGGIVLVVALAGIVVNLAATLVLSRASRQSLNVRGAFLHVATDLVAFVGTAVAGAIVLTTGWDRADPLASLLVAGLMFWASYSLVRDSTGIFLELAPREIDPTDVGKAIVSVPNVVEAHDLHVWTVTSGFPAVSAHVLVDPGADCHGVRRTIEIVLRERFDLEHTTLQVDHAGPQPSVNVELGESFRRSSPL